MPHADIVEKYLTRVILFKEKKDLFTEYADETKRYFLLRKLFEDLDFDKDLWNVRADFAKQSFQIYLLLDYDYEAGRVAPKIYQALLEKYLKRAIALDPYNIEYLKAYFNGPVGNDKSDKKLAIHYISLFHPNSAEFQNLLVDLRIKSSEIVFDCLSETVTIPFIREMVFLSKKSKAEYVESQSSKELEELAATAGLDSGTIKKINDSIPGLLDTVYKVVENNHWLDWTGVHKAVLSMDQAIDLAPYDKDVLLTALIFYGRCYWRFVLGYREIKGNNGKDEFMEYVFGVKKPKRELQYSKALELFSKTENLKERLLRVVEKEELELAKNIKKRAEYYIPDLGGAMNGHLRLKRKMWFRFDDVNKINVNAHLDKETVVFQLCMGHFKSKKHFTKIALVIAIPIIILICLFSWLVLKTPFPFFPFFVLAFFIPMGVLYLKEKIWQNKKMEINEELNRTEMIY